MQATKYFDLLKPGVHPYNGLIGQTEIANRDQGDTLQREGQLAILAHLLFKQGKMSLGEYSFIVNRYFNTALDKLECPDCPGNFRRSNIPGYWGTDCDRMSRDQWMPNAVALGLLKNRKMLRRMFWAHLKRALLFTTNTRRNWAYKPGHPEHDPKKYRWKLPDLTVFSSWNHYIRGFRLYFLYPFVVLFDIDILINSILKVKSYGKDPSNSDDLNHINALIDAKYNSMPTPISWLARKIYAKWRPKTNPPGSGYKSDWGPQTAMDHYFRREAGGTAFDDLYRDCLEEALR